MNRKSEREKEYKREEKKKDMIQKQESDSKRKDCERVFEEERGDRKRN